MESSEHEKLNVQSILTCLKGRKPTSKERREVGSCVFQSEGLGETKLT